MVRSEQVGWCGFGVSARFSRSGKIGSVSMVPSIGNPKIRLNNVIKGTTGEVKASVVEQSLIEGVCSLLFGTLLAMTARPELVERGKCERVIEARKDRPRKEFWSPNIVGRRYRTKIEGGGSHASPRMHWRRGHFRSQPYGLHRAERKTLWIEPCLISAAA